MSTGADTVTSVQHDLPTIFEGLLPTYIAESMRRKERTDFTSRARKELQEYVMKAWAGLGVNWSAEPDDDDYMPLCALYGVAIVQVQAGVALQELTPKVSLLKSELLRTYHWLMLITDGKSVRVICRTRCYGEWGQPCKMDIIWPDGVPDLYRQSLEKVQQLGVRPAEYFHRWLYTYFVEQAQLLPELKHCPSERLFEDNQWLALMAEYVKEVSRLEKCRQKILRLKTGRCEAVEKFVSRCQLLMKKIRRRVSKTPVSP
ncbi:MAG: hypothetical protein Q4F35_08620 [Akkermansia sp.]|nr:hypothetical protein [Akkermansia sp.]